MEKSKWAARRGEAAIRPRRSAYESIHQRRLEQKEQTNKRTHTHTKRNGRQVKATYGALWAVAGFWLGYVSVPGAVGPVGQSAYESCRRSGHSMMVPSVGHLLSIFFPLRVIRSSIHLHTHTHTQRERERENARRKRGAAFFFYFFIDAPLTDVSLVAGSAASAILFFFHGPQLLVFGCRPRA